MPKQIIQYQNPFGFVHISYQFNNNQLLSGEYSIKKADRPNETEESLRSDSRRIAGELAQIYGPYIQDTDTKNAVEEFVWKYGDTQIALRVYRPENETLMRLIYVCMSLAQAQTAAPALLKKEIWQSII